MYSLLKTFDWAGLLTTEHVFLCRLRRDFRGAYKVIGNDEVCMYVHRRHLTFLSNLDTSRAPSTTAHIYAWEIISSITFQRNFCILIYSAHKFKKTAHIIDLLPICTSLPLSLYFAIERDTRDIIFRLKYDWKFEKQQNRSLVWCCRQ